MTVGLAFYGVEYASPAENAAFAEEVFKSVGVAPERVHYYVERAPDAQGETLFPVEARWSDFTPDTPMVGLPSFEGKGFRLEIKVPELAAVPHYAIVTDIDDRALIKRAFCMAGNFCKASYGIGYTAKTEQLAYSYSYVANSQSVLENEAPLAFVDDQADWCGGPDSFRGARLRMVYPLNFLNAQHLRIDVTGQPLDDWIGGDPARGTIEQVSPERWLWTVPEASVQHVNDILGPAGILICWQKPRVPARKRLP